MKISSYCCPPNTKLYRFVILLPSKHKTVPFRHTAALQTQNCTVSSYCCPPNTKLYHFVILLPSKHKTAPFRHTAALQTQNCTVSSYCCPPNKTHPPLPNSFPLLRIANCHFPSPYRLHFPTLHLISSLPLLEGRAGSAQNSTFSVSHIETIHIVPLSRPIFVPPPPRIFCL